MALWLIVKILPVYLFSVITSQELYMIVNFHLVNQDIHMHFFESSQWKSYHSIQTVKLEVGHVL